MTKVSLIKQPLPTIDYYNELTKIKVEHKKYRDLEDAWMETDYHIVEEFCYYGGYDINIVLPIIVGFFSELKRLILEGHEVETPLGIFSIIKVRGKLQWFYKATLPIRRMVEAHLSYERELNFPRRREMEPNASITTDINRKY